MTEDEISAAEAEYLTQPEHSEDEELRAEYAEYGNEDPDGGLAAELRRAEMLSKRAENEAPPVKAKRARKKAGAK
jgi:hypothetical protein